MRFIWSCGNPFIIAFVWSLCCDLNICSIDAFSRTLYWVAEMNQSGSNLGIVESLFIRTTPAPWILHVYSVPVDCNCRNERYNMGQLCSLYKVESCIHIQSLHRCNQTFQIYFYLLYKYLNITDLLVFYLCALLFFAL